MSVPLWEKSHTESGFGHVMVVMVQRNEKGVVIATTSFCRSCFRRAKNPSGFREVDPCVGSGEPSDSNEQRRQELVLVFGSNVKELEHTEQRRGAGWGTTLVRQPNLTS